MLQQMIGFFMSAFSFPGLSWNLVLIAIGLGFVLGAIWLAAYRPPLFSRYGLWLVGLISAFLTWTAIAFVQIPLQGLLGQALGYWDQQTLMAWLLLAGVPQILASGIVQEAAKIAPVIGYRRCTGWKLEPRMGLMVGAVAGAGFGIFEAVWVHNTIFAGGWNWGLVETNGFLALLGFIERFSAVGFHIAASALAGYGLARGLGWQFYFIAAGLHSLLNYSIVLLQKGVFNAVHLEIYAFVLALAVTAVALWLRWRKSDRRAVPGEQELTSD